MADNNVNALIYIVLFWSILTILSGYFEQTILLGDINSLVNENPTEMNFIEKVFNFTNNIPILNNFVPLFRIMTFQYSSQVPPIISTLLIVFGVVSAYICYEMLRGN